MRAIDARQVRGARSRRDHGLARALLAGRVLPNADQLSRHGGRADRRCLGRRLAQRRSPRAAGRLLTGRRREFHPEQAVPPGRGRDRQRHAASGDEQHAASVALHRGRGRLGQQVAGEPPASASATQAKRTAAFRLAPGTAAADRHRDRQLGLAVARRPLPRALRRAGSVRPDDPRRRRRAVVVQAAASGCARRGPARAGIRRPAGADVVGGPARGGRAARRRGRDRKQRLSTDRDRARRKRLSARPARVSDNPAGHCAVHGLRRDSLQPERLRWTKRRRGRRHALSGSGPQDRARALRVARAGPRRAGQLLPADQTRAL